MHQPRKRFGQHFLTDPSVIARIVDTVNPQPGERLVEIGPGLGAITWPLLNRVGRLDAVEFDRDLVARLERDARGHGRLAIHEADALGFDFRTLAAGEPLRVVGNLPYNISTPLTFHLLSHIDAILDVHAMLQREVVRRMAALPGNRTYGRLTVMLAPHVDVEPLFDISRDAFDPPPRVESAFVRLVPHRTPPFDIHDPALFAALVTQAFSQRRKTVRNALRTRVPEAIIEAAGVDPGLRPEAISPAQFATLSNLAGDILRA